MIHRAPVAFDEALASRDVRSLLPTDGSARQLNAIAAELRERATFSARTDNAHYLQRIADTVEQVLGRKTGGVRLNRAYARQQLRESLAGLGYHPGTAGIKPRSLQDFASDARLKVIVDTNVDLAAGYGQHVQGNTPNALKAFPCQELYRQTERRAKRPWHIIWVRNGGKLYGAQRRMIARKDAPIWKAISRFGNPYPPFDYNSGMWVKDVSRRDAEALGVVGFDAPQKPAPARDLNADLSRSAPDRHTDLLKAILKQHGDTVELRNGRLHFKGSA